MSKIITESTIYPGWEAHRSDKNRMMTEEKALLITAKQNFIFSYAKTGAILGFLVGVYNIFVKFNITEDRFNFSNLLVIISLHVLAAGLIGYMLGIVFAKLYKK